MDIDTVSLLNYAFSENGNFIHWTDIIDTDSYELLKASQKLPFPTGIQITEGEDIDTSAVIKTYRGKEYIDLKDPSTIVALANLIRKVNKLEGKVNIKNKTLINIINKHNSYIQRLIKRKGNYLDAAKNYISYNMQDIILNPVNVIQAMSPIDDAVGEGKKVANNTEEAKKITNLPGNSYNIGREQASNTAGKEVTGIVAAGMKALLGITHATNKALQEGTDDDVVYVQFNNQIGELTLTISGNAYTTRLTNEKVLEAFNNSRNEYDNLLILSALLSLATDNAKELALSKLNATKELVNMYIAGITVGLNFQEISEFLTHPLAMKIIKSMRGNLYNKVSDLSRFSSVVSYINLGPTLELKGYGETIYNILIKNLEKKGIDTSRFTNYINGIVNNSNNPDYSDYEDVVDPEIEGNSKSTDIYKLPLIIQMYASNTIDHMWSDDEFVTNIIDELQNLQEDGKYSSNREIEKLIKWVKLKSQIVKEDLAQDSKHIFRNLTTLSDMGQEMSTLVTLFSSNQGMKTNTGELINFKNKLESIFDVIINKRVNKFSVGNKTYSGVRAELEKLNGETNDYTVHFNRFFNDADYRNQIIALYDRAKIAFNIPYILVNNEHYFGYLNVINIVDVMSKLSSFKYNNINKYLKRVASDMKMLSSNDMSKVSKAIESYINYYIINSWLREEVDPVLIPEGSILYDNEGKTSVTTDNVPIILGTASGNATFKHYFEYNILQKAKNGDIPGLVNNPFIRSLIPFINTRTSNKKPEIVYSLNIEMIPKTEEEITEYENYKDYLADLKNYEYNGMSLLDLVFLYNMVTYGMQSSNRALTKMFSDFLRDNSYDLYSKFIKYESEMESIDYDFSKESLEVEVAARGSNPNSRFKFFYDFDRMRYYLKSRRGYEYKNLETAYSRPKIPTLENAMVKLNNDIVLKRYKNDPESEYSRNDIEYIVYKGKTISRDELQKYVDEYNKKHPTSNASLDNIIIYRIYKENTQSESVNEKGETIIKDTSKKKYALDPTMTAESIERILNDPC